MGQAEVGSRPGTPGAVHPDPGGLRLSDGALGQPFGGRGHHREESQFQVGLMDLGGLQQFLQNRRNPVSPVGHRGLVEKGIFRTDRSQQGRLMHFLGQSHQHAIQIAGAQHGFEVRIDSNLAAPVPPGCAAGWPGWEPRRLPPRPCRLHAGPADRPPEPSYRSRQDRCAAGSCQGLLSSRQPHDGNECLVASG